MSFARREFLALSGALCVGVTLPRAAGAAKSVAAGRSTALTAYVAIEPGGLVRVLSPASEMGQGTFAAHAAIVADELGVDYSMVRVETAMPADPYRHPGPGGAPASQSTGGSWGVRRWHGPLRKGAAQAREMLIAAAAARSGRAAAEFAVSDGVVKHATVADVRYTFGELAADAARLPPPPEPLLRPRSARHFVGARLERPDIPDKVRGRTVYSSDFRRPGMVYACARIAPVEGAKVTRIDRASALAVKGVIEVVALPNGAAIVASSQWAAMQGARSLVIGFGRTANDSLDSAAVSAAMREGLGAVSRAVLRSEGDFEAALANAARVVTADYEVPYLANAPLEPWSCTAEIAADGTLDLWGPFQAQDRARTGAARALGIDGGRVRVHTLQLGGGFGRRLNDDGVPAAVLVARAMRKPVKLFWTRETEFAAGFGRPAQMARITAALDPSGRVTGLHFRASGPSLVLHFSPSPPAVPDATFLDSTSVQNLDVVRYAFGAYRVDYALRHNHFPTGPWRSVGATQNAFFLESFIDEIAHATGRDPVQLRRELLVHDPRALRVIDEAAGHGGWGTPVKPGHALGFAYFECYGSLCAHVAEVSIESGVPRVHRVVCVLDCGEVVTPDGARAQAEGGIVQGLSATLGEALTLQGGAAIEQNFDTYPLLRLPEAPRKIEVHFIQSGEPLGGVGEPVLPPIAPAVANAVRVLTGKPVRCLPILAPAQNRTLSGVRPPT